MGGGADHVSKSVNNKCWLKNIGFPIEYALIDGRTLLRVRVKLFFFLNKNMQGNERLVRREQLLHAQR